MNLEEKELKILRKQLKDMETFNQKAWDQYGSELCAGEMENNEKKLRDKINNIES